MTKDEVNHLCGKTFIEGKDDCLGLTRQFFREFFDIQIPNIARPSLFYEKNVDLFGRYYPELGFRVLNVHPSKWQVGDVVMMGLYSQYANHCGVLINENQILHHLYNSPSRVDDYNSDWRTATLYMLRHKDVKPMVETNTTTDIRSLIPAHIKERLDAAGVG